VRPFSASTNAAVYGSTSSSLPPPGFFFPLDDALSAQAFLFSRFPRAYRRNRASRLSPLGPRVHTRLFSDVAIAHRRCLSRFSLSAFSLVPPPLISSLLELFTPLTRSFGRPSPAPPFSNLCIPPIAVVARAVSDLGSRLSSRGIRHATRREDAGTSFSVFVDRASSLANWAAFLLLPLASFT